MTEPLLLRVEDVARALSLGRSKVYELIAARELPSITIGAARRIPAAALHAWIAERVGRDGRQEP